MPTVARNPWKGFEFGPYGSVLTLAVGAIAEAHGKILWNHGGASDEIFARGWRRQVGGIAPASAYFATLPAWLRRREPGIDRQAFGRGPEYPAAQAFAMGVIAAKCVRLAGSLRDDTLREMASSLDVTTCLGRFRIDPQTGWQIGHRPVLVEWGGGRKIAARSPAEKETSCLLHSTDD